MVRLGALLMLLFLAGISTCDSSSPPPLALQLPPTRLRRLLTVPPAAPLLELFSTLPPRRLFQPSSSRSIRSDFSFSSLSSRSARRAVSWLDDSEDWSSSMVLRSLSTLSRILVTSSASWVFCLSLRSIWPWRSLTVRSTLRTERCSFVRSASRSSSWVSSY